MVLVDELLDGSDFFSNYLGAYPILFPLLSK